VTSGLASRIPAGASVLVDTSVVLAYLTGTEPGSPPATQLFDAFVATGRNTAGLSMIPVGEILVRPFRRGPSAVATAEGFLQHFGDLRLLPVDYVVAREGARIRALTDLAMPDALIVATARVAGADLVVTNDRAWEGPMSTAYPDLPVVVLGDTA
jgi:predicted nucleic acid-binding protein